MTELASVVMQGGAFPMVTAVPNLKVLSRALTYAKASMRCVSGHAQDPTLSEGAA